MTPCLPIVCEESCPHLLLRMTLCLSQYENGDDLTLTEGEPLSSHSALMGSASLLQSDSVYILMIPINSWPRPRGLPIPTDEDTEIPTVGWQSLPTPHFQGCGHIGWKSCFLEEEKTEARTIQTWSKPRSWASKRSVTLSVGPNLLLRATVLCLAPPIGHIWYHIFRWWVASTK